MNGLKRKSLGIAVTIALTVALVSGCGNGNKETTVPATSIASQPASSSESPKTAEPISISLMIPYWNPEAPKANSEVLKEVQSYTNTNLNISWVPASSYNDKLNALIASQDVPQIVYVLANGNKNSGLVNAVRSGMFWEIGPYLKEYPNLSQTSKDLLKQSAIDGKTYGIFKSFPQARDGITIRKDWLNSLQLQEPKTLDELIHVMEAFALQDPDKNGKKDTFAVGSSAGLNGFNNFVLYNGGPNQWGIVDGKITPNFLTKSYKETLDLYKYFYEKNIINQDFPSVTSDFELFNKGKSGMIFGALDDIQSRYADLYKSYPEAELDVISLIEGPDGARVPTRGVFPPQFLFPKTSIKTEEQLKQILGYMDKLADSTVQNLLKWGIEGVHYEVENGKAVRTDAQRFTQEVSQLDFLQYTEYKAATPGTLQPVVEKALKMQVDNFPNAIVNPAQPLISDTFVQNGSELDKIINEARTKYVMGQLDEAGWNKAVEQWRKNGGDKVIAEYSAEYNKLNP
ncbi:extracellular solute-binding protein [Cohnella abietis]|uniref:Putative ABC transporter peptide-binding protein YtcQ n=1 Tax=Cohnella abietis TaxID=2507935 RepID=A0A3T1DEI1_9BACL|nr:extracellular solute-binding protein [Cohnella abietis]BBI36502.1 putative ABC transporter peptide-binding protein YtcQ [Cohnella abietis]